MLLVLKEFYLFIFIKNDNKYWLIYIIFVFVNVFGFGLDIILKWLLYWKSGYVYRYVLVFNLYKYVVCF